MAFLVNYVFLEPLVTGSVLYILRRGSPALRTNILQPFSYLPHALRITGPTLVTSLKWLFGLGVLNRINSWLSRFALNNWRINDGGKAWDWQNEVAVVTGGSGGIGSEVVQRLAEKGVKVAIMDLQPPPANLKSLKNVHFYDCDITSPTSVTSTADSIRSSLGPVTILFNNAGIGKTFTILDAPDDYLEKIFHVNLISQWYTVRAFLPDMIAAKKGHVVATASMASFINAAGMVDYCVTKAGVMSFHEGLTQELKHRYNAPFIKTTVVHPYWVRTALISGWVEKSLDALMTPIMTPGYVADEITKAIFSGRSHQVVLPKWMGAVAGLRACAIWAQELVRDSTRKMTLENPKAPKV